MNDSGNFQFLLPAHFLGDICHDLFPKRHVILKRRRESASPVMGVGSEVNDPGLCCDRLAQPKRWFALRELGCGSL